MEHLPKKIHQNGINYTLVGDYYIPDLRLPEESRPIGRWGRMHQAFLQEHRPGQYNALLLSGKLWTYLADLNEQMCIRDSSYRKSGLMRYRGIRDCVCPGKSYEKECLYTSG